MIHGKKVVPARLPSEEWEKDCVLDLIMQYAYPGESLRMSLSRLATAAGWLGYTVLHPTFVFITYRKLKHELSERPFRQ